MFCERVPIIICNYVNQSGTYRLDYLNFFTFKDDGKSITITRITDQAPACATLNHPFFTTRDFYFEAEMTKGNNSIVLGLTPETTLKNLTDVNGKAIRVWDISINNCWPYDSAYSYHGDTGKVWNGKVGTICGEYLKVNDVIDCGFNNDKGHIFFTLNGEKLEQTFDIDRKSTWYPLMACRGEGAELEVNLGGYTFSYQPTMIPAKAFPKPESFCDEWTKQIDHKCQAPTNLDHLMDVTIVSKDREEIKCHGLVLSVRSKVFSKMLEPAKTIDNIICMKDFDAQTIEKMLTFLYSDKVEEDDFDMDLLGLANMYQIESLEIVCEKRLSNELEVNNVLDAWVGASLFKRNTFRDICEQFIKSHWLEIQNAESFSRLMKENGDAMLSLTVKLLNIDIDQK